MMGTLRCARRSGRPKVHIARTRSWKMLRALVRGLLGLHEIVGGIDQSNMRESLRKVADEATSQRVVLLRQQPDVIAEPNETLEKSTRLIGAAEHQEAVGQPKTACQEGAFARRQTVLAPQCVVAQDKAIDDEIALNGHHRAAHARI